MRPGGESFCVADFLWEEIKDISESLIKACGYGPYIMGLIEKVVGRSFPTDMVHKPLKILPTKKPIVPSSGRYDEQEDEQQDAAQQHDQQPHAPQPSQRDMHSRQPSEPSSRSHGKPPPVRWLFNLFIGMCKIQRDIHVELRQQRINSKKGRDAIKKMHAAMNLETPPPISPEHVEPEIPPLETMLIGFQQAGYYEQYEHIFAPGSSSQQGMDACGSSLAPIHLLHR